MAGGFFSGIFNAVTGPNSPIPSSVNQAFGEENIDNTLLQPPRIVWVPPQDEDLNDGEGYQGWSPDSTAFNRVINGRRALWEVHLWGWAPFTEVKLAGTSTGIVTPSQTVAGTLGDPAGVHKVIVRIDVQGDPGVASWSSSMDGAAYVSHGTALSADLGQGIAATLALPPGAVAGNNFKAGDTFTFSTPGLSQDHYDAAEQLLNLALAAVKTQVFYNCNAVAKKMKWTPNPTVATFGRYGILLIEFRVPVTMPASTVVSVTGFSPVTTARQDPTTGLLELNV